MNKQEDHVQTAVRLPKKLMARLDKLASQMSLQGIRITRAEVLRQAAFRGVDLMETEQKRGR